MRHADPSSTPCRATLAALAVLMAYLSLTAAAFAGSSPPAVTLVSPACGATTGGTTVTITGTGFATGDTVTFGTGPGAPTGLNPVVNGSRDHHHGDEPGGRRRGHRRGHRERSVERHLRAVLRRRVHLRPGRPVCDPERRSGLREPVRRHARDDLGPGRGIRRQRQLRHDTGRGGVLSATGRRRSRELGGTPGYLVAISPPGVGTVPGDRARCRRDVGGEQRRPVHLRPGQRARSGCAPHRRRSATPRGNDFTLAAGHPASVTAGFSFATAVGADGRESPVHSIKDFVAQLPAGFLASLNAVAAQCPEQDFDGAARRRLPRRLTGRLAGHRRLGKHTRASRPSTSSRGRPVISPRSPCSRSSRRTYPWASGWIST